MNIIYTPSREAAERKIKELQYVLGGVLYLGADYVFLKTNTEQWHWLNPAWSIRGHRAQKALVDNRCTQEQLTEVIAPQIYHCEKVIYLDM